MPSVKNIALSQSVCNKLAEFCKKNKLLKGEAYYRVPDFNKAVTLLLKEYGKARKT